MPYKHPKFSAHEQYENKKFRESEEGQRLFQAMEGAKRKVDILAGRVPPAGYGLPGQHGMSGPGALGSSSGLMPPQGNLLAGQIHPQQAPGMGGGQHIGGQTRPQQDCGGGLPCSIPGQCEFHRGTNLKMKYGILAHSGGQMMPQQPGLPIGGGPRPDPFPPQYGIGMNAGMDQGGLPIGGGPGQNLGPEHAAAAAAGMLQPPGMGYPGLGGNMMPPGGGLNDGGFR